MKYAINYLVIIQLDYRQGLIATGVGVATPVVFSLILLFYHS